MMAFADLTSNKDRVRKKKSKRLELTYIDLLLWFLISQKVAIVSEDTLVRCQQKRQQSIDLQ